MFKTVLFNLLGDEWGGGELWDAYELYKDPKQFMSTFLQASVYIIAGFMIITGLVFLILYLISGILMYETIFLILGGGMLLVIMFAYHHYKNHK